METEFCVQIYPLGWRIPVSAESTRKYPGTFPTISGVAESADIESWYTRILEAAKTRERVIMLDIGAQIGLYTLPAGTVPQLEVYAFEPHPDRLRLLKDNVRLNLLEGQVHCVGLAVSSQSSVRTLHGDSLGFELIRGDRAGGWEDENTVDTISLDEWASQAGVGHVDFIKMDIEGWEFYALQGAQRLIQRSRPVLQLEWCSDNMRECHVEEQSLRKWLEQEGYRCVSQLGENQVWTYTGPAGTGGGSTLAADPSAPR